MPKQAVLTSYSKLDDSQLLTTSQQIYASLNPNSAFKWSAEEMTLFNSEIGAFEDLLIEAKSGNAQVILRKNVARETLLNRLRLFAMSVNIQADGDVIKLRSTNFTLAKEKEKVGLLPKPTDFKVVSGDNGGELVCTVKAHAKARMYCFYFAPVPSPASFDEWKNVMSSTHKKKIADFIPGKQYEFRCAYKGSEDEVVYSDPITIFAQ